MKYFAYGSNMLTERLTDRVSSARNPTRLSLRKYRLRFHKGSGDGSGKCNVVKTESDQEVVHGVLFDINDGQIRQLDRHEGVGYGYQKCEMTVPVDGVETKIFLYVAEEGWIDDSLVPYCWYHKLVLYGAEQHGLPKDYIAWLRAIPCSRDPNPRRPSQLCALAVLRRYKKSK